MGHEVKEVGNWAPRGKKAKELESGAVYWRIVTISNSEMFKLTENKFQGIAVSHYGNASELIWSELDEKGQLLIKNKLYSRLKFISFSTYCSWKYYFPVFWPGISRFQTVQVRSSPSACTISLK